MLIWNITWHIIFTLRTENGIPWYEQCSQGEIVILRPVIKNLRYDTFHLITGIESLHRYDLLKCRLKKISQTIILLYSYNLRAILFFRVGHLFLEDDINRLNQVLLKSVSYNKSLWPKRNISSASENVWLVYNKQRLLKNDLKQISHVFHQSPLSMDALVFTFTEEGQGMT